MTDKQIDITFLEGKKQHWFQDCQGESSIPPTNGQPIFAQPPSMMRNSLLLKRGHFILSEVINVESSLLLENIIFPATSTITTT